MMKTTKKVRTGLQLLKGKPGGKARVAKLRIRYCKKESGSTEAGAAEAVHEASFSLIT